MEKPEKVLCINGPNLDLLGRRSPDIYGTATLEELEERVTEWGSRAGLEVTCRQSNHEGELVEWVHAGTGYDGVVLNGGALTHYSWALADAVSSIATPVVEVHLSNIRSRQRWRRRSLLTPVVVASLFGRGAQGYRHALRHLVNRAAWPTETARYGPHPDQVVDLRRASPGADAAVLIHGGFWLDSWGRDTVETWAVDLARRGISSAAVEYRRFGSGGSPVATRHDVTEAVRLARQQLGVNQVAVIGHSAGATLAVWHLLEGERRPTVTVGVSGLFDLAAGASLGEGAPGRFDPEGSLDLMDQPLPDGRVVLVHGDADEVVPVGQSIAYRDRMVEKDGSVQLECVHGQGHFDSLAADSPAWELVLSALVGTG
ncbi:MAG: type II 3-dehydroquinate dehydratase [Acidimicrobiia bacterium]